MKDILPRHPERVLAGTDHEPGVPADHVPMRFRPGLQAVARGHVVQAEPIGVGQRFLPNWRNTRLVDDDTERQGHRLPCTADLNGVRPLPCCVKSIRSSSGSQERRTTFRLA